MNLKYPLLVTIFLATRALFASDTMDVADTLACGAAAMIQQETLKEWTFEEKIAVFRKVQAQLTPHHIVLSDDKVVNKGTLDLSWQLSDFLPEIKNQILTEIYKFS